MPATTKTETFVYATYIRTTPEKLWEALTEGDFTEKYWFGSRFEGDLRAGGRMRILQPKGSTNTCGDHNGEILVCEPPRKLVYTWVMNDPAEVAQKRSGPSRVTYELTPMGAQVRLRLIHENLLPEDIHPGSDTYKGINNGWPAVLSSLKSLLETGEPIVYTMPKAEAPAAASGR